MKELKKSLALILSIVMIFCMLTIGNLTAFADTVASGTCGEKGDNLTWTLDSEGLLTISGEGEMEEYNECAASEPWKDYNVLSVNIESGVTSIGVGAFYHCTTLSEITIPGYIEKIGSYAFYECSGLKQISICDGVKIIGQEAFWGTGIAEITIPESVTYAGEWAFGGCANLQKALILGNVNTTNPLFFDSKLKTLEFGNNVTNIGEYAFADCKTIKNIIFGDSVTDIRDHAFCYTGIESIVIPDGVTVINSSVFEGCSELTNVVFSKSLISIESNAFYGCTLLKNITIPESVESIGVGAFADTGLKSIKILNNDCVIADNASTIPGGTVIYGHIDSTAHKYALKYDNDFVDIDQVDCPPTFSEAIDEQTGVSVIYPDGAFDGAAEIQVTPVSEGEAYRLISHKEGNYKVTMFDISVTVDGEQVQPNGMVTVRMPLPKGYNPNKCVVYYVAADGTMEELTTYHVKDGYVYFETDHFSYYAVVEEESGTSDRPSWMDDSLNFVQAIIDFFNRLAAWFKSIFGVA